MLLYIKLLLHQIYILFEHTNAYQINQVNVESPKFSYNCNLAEILSRNQSNSYYKFVQLSLPWGGGGCPNMFLELQYGYVITFIVQYEM